MTVEQLLRTSAAKNITTPQDDVINEILLIEENRKASNRFRELRRRMAERDRRT